MELLLVFEPFLSQFFLNVVTFTELRLIGKKVVVRDRATT